MLGSVKSYSSDFMSIQSQLGIFIIVVTPARIAQYSYDKARLLAATPFGWLAFGLFIGKTQSLYPFHQSLILH